MSMWPPWRKSPPTKSDQFQPLSPSTSSSSFRCSSFKDIETLFLHPDQQTPNPNRPSHQHRRLSIFHRVRTANTLLRHWAPPKPKPQPETKPEYPDSIVVYYTSLHVVRPTFEACRTVLSILRGFRISIDERDVSMDPTFMSELKEILGSKDKTVSLPRVFIGGRHIGGVDEVVQLNEIGELKNMLQGVPRASGDTCEACGGYRFVLCDECNGSHKIFSHKLGGLRTCGGCSENGLVRCHRCFAPT